MYKIGIIGYGVVGKAVAFGLEKLGHEIIIHDKKLNTSIKDIADTHVVFICVPTPSNQDNSCDTSIVDSVVKELKDIKYHGVIVIKSTVTPGTTERLSRENPNVHICFIPEFLRERCAISDFMENHDLCAIGTDNIDVFNFLKTIHGYYPKEFRMLSKTEAELLKYYSNTYNALLVVLSNTFFEICNSLNLNYDRLKNALICRSHISDQYLNCNVNFRGYGGTCLPKDIKAMEQLCIQLKNNCSLFSFIDKENDKYKKTVFKGMRE